MSPRMPSRPSFVFGSALIVAAVVTSLPAFAQEAPTQGPESAPPNVVAPAPGQAAASAPSSAAVPITATCSLGDHPGIEDDEAQTAADVLCHELAKLRATTTQHEVRFGKLGGKVLVTIASRSGNTYDERRSLLTSMDELPVAAPRLASALENGQSVEETRNVDNVLATETRTPKVQRGQMGFDGGIFGMTSIGASAGGSAGVNLGLLYRAGSFGVSSQGRAGGIGSSDAKIGLASLDIGARYYLSDAEVAPFVGAGLELAYFDLSRSNGAGIDGSGLAGFGQLGMEFLRSHHAALSTSLRVDAPFFELGSGPQARYVLPISLNIGIMFR